jgi:ribonuclease VapC
MFLDSSAIVAILAREPDWEALALKIEPPRQVIVSPLAIYEAVLGLVRSQSCEIETAESLVDQFLKQANAALVTIDGPIGRGAVAAFSRFGKGRHRAGLNMGDCFSYACAKSHRVALLFKGDDFVHTDIRIA